MIMSLGVGELRELVAAREEELRYAHWKLADAKKRLEAAEAHEAATAERQQAAATATAAAVKVGAVKPEADPNGLEQSHAHHPEQKQELQHTPKQEEEEDEEEEEEEASLISEYEEIQPNESTHGDKSSEENGHEHDRQHKDKSHKSEPDTPVYPWTVLPEHVKVDAGAVNEKSMTPSCASGSGARASGANKAPKFAGAARRADSTQQHSGYGKADTPERHGLLPPPPPPPPEQVKTMCPTPCGCGKPCTRVERMIRQQHSSPFARTRLKHNNHACDVCQQEWYAATHRPRHRR